MANIIPAIQKYTTDIIDEVFADSSFIEKWFVNSKKYLDLNFQEAGAVKIMSILLDGMSDYYKVNHSAVANSQDYAHDNGNNGDGARDGLKRGNVQSKWTVYFLHYLRGRQIPVDWIDNEESANLIIAKTLSEFIRTQYVPEFDTLGFSRLAGATYATFGNQVTGAGANGTISANAIISDFNAGIEYMRQCEVPDEDIVIFVSPITMRQIKETTELTHYIFQQDFKSETGVSFKLMAYEGHPIVEVPSDRFYTNAVAGANGTYAGANSYQINFLLASRRAMIPVKKLEWSKIYGNEVVTDFKGWLIDFLAYFDFIVPTNKTPAVYASVSTLTATTVAKVLRVGMVAGSATGTTSVVCAISAPAGVAGTLVYCKTAPTVGSALTIDGSTVVAVPTDSVNGNYAQFTPVSTALTSGKAYFALVDGSGNCAAVSALITLPVAG